MGINLVEEQGDSKKKAQPINLRTEACPTNQGRSPSPARTRQLRLSSGSQLLGAGFGWASMRLGAFCRGSIVLNLLRHNLPQSFGFRRLRLGTGRRNQTFVRCRTRTGRAS